MNPETEHPREEEAIAYAFGLMDAASRAAFEQDLKRDAALRSLVAELQGTAAGLAFDAPQQAVPEDLRATVLASVTAIPQERSVKAPVVVDKSRAGSNAWRWATVAALAVITGIYVVKTNQVNSANYRVRSQQLVFEMESAEMQKEMDTLKKNSVQLQSQMDALQATVTQSNANTEALKQQLADASRAAETLKQELAQRTKLETELKSELARLTKTNELNKVQIATLQSTVAEYKQGVAVVVWNSDTQQGILKLEKMPPVEQGKDYQLWVVDPAKQKPVNAGIVQVDDQGFAKVEFKPVVEIEKASNFAISVEKKGGVPENEGPIVLLSP